MVELSELELAYVVNACSFVEYLLSNLAVSPCCQPNPQNFNTTPQVLLVLPTIYIYPILETKRPV
jgi:hypothetical protein